VHNKIGGGDFPEERLSVGIGTVTKYSILPNSYLSGEL